MNTSGCIDIGFRLFFSALCFAVVFPLAQAEAGGRAAERYPVAMRNFGVWEPQTRERLDFSVWYPSRVGGASAVREGWIVEVAQSRHMLPGFYPVILISHDTASGRFANNDLAVALASAGMVVIVPAHADDNQNASGAIYTPGLIKDRPRHLLRALETVLGTPEFAPHVDESRIGLLGVGFGAITVMQLAGAVPDFSRLRGYCVPTTGRDAFCAPWTRERLEGMPQALLLLVGEDGLAALSPPLDLFAPALMPVFVSPEELRAADEARRRHAGTQRAFFWQRFLGGGGASSDRFAQSGIVEQDEDADAPDVLDIPVTLDFQGGSMFGYTSSGARFVYIVLPGSGTALYAARSEAAPDAIAPGQDLITIDPSVNPYRRPAEIRKIRAAALMAPAGGMLFSRAALENIHIPVAIIEAGQDGLYPPSQHAYPYFVNLPAQPALLQLPKADHFSLFARCSKETMLNLGDICGRVQGNARQDLALRRDTFFVSFFRANLGGPLLPALPSGYVADERAQAQP